MLILLLLFLWVFLLGATWICFFLSYCIAKWRKSPESARGNGKVLKWLNVSCALTALFIWLIFLPPAPFIYHREFGESPIFKVQDLHGYSSLGHDGGETFLRFQTEPSTIQRLAKARKLPRVALVNFDSQNFYGPNSPDWWQPKPDSQTWIFNTEKPKDSFSRESVSLIYDPQTRIAHYGFFFMD